MFDVAEFLQIPVYVLKRDMPMHEFLTWVRRLQKPEAAGPEPLDLEHATPAQLQALFG